MGKHKKKRYRICEKKKGTMRVSFSKKEVRETQVDETHPKDDRGPQRQQEHDGFLEQKDQRSFNELKDRLGDGFSRLAVVVDGDERETGLLREASSSIPKDGERIGFRELEEQRKVCTSKE